MHNLLTKPVAARWLLSRTAALYCNKLRGRGNMELYLCIVYLVLAFAFTMAQDTHAVSDATDLSYLKNNTKNDIGLPGAIGAKGDIGPPGAIGAKGDVGPPGAIGAKGDVGPSGSIGAKGDVGPPGAIGAKGDVGPPGAIGAKGDAGPPGCISAKGDVGPSGAIGAKGDVGPSGAIGAKGDVGPSGAIGAKGDAGPPGLKCVEGESFQRMQEEFSQLRSEVNLLLPSDCKAAFLAGNTESGIYNVKVKKRKIQVFCDMETDGGGWTVFQRRINGEQDFFLNWDDYRQGFGNLSGEFWMGLDNLHHFTSHGNTQLRIEIKDCDNQTHYAKYGSFAVLGPSTDFQLQISSFVGSSNRNGRYQYQYQSSSSIPDSLGAHNGRAFSTKDRDNDRSRLNCAETHHGAWWYNNCHSSNLNGEYLPCVEQFHSMTWDGTGRNKKLQFSEMKFRRN